MRLGSRHSGFVFSLPETFLNKKEEEYYLRILKKNHIPYQRPIHYLNSTIKNITLPGLGFQPPKQTGAYGKVIHKKPAITSEDLVTTHEVNITFKSIDNDLNYWMFYDIFLKKYDGTYENQYIDFIQLHVIDDYREVIYTVKFINLIFNGLSDILLDYTQQKITGKEFTVTFTYNWIEIDFALDESKILDNSYRPVIVLKYDNERKTKG